MNKLNELSNMSQDRRRLELARLLAIGVIRVLTQRVAQSCADEKEFEETSPDGLDDS